MIKDKIREHKRKSQMNKKGLMTRPVAVDFELSHLSEENRWEVSNTEEYIKALEVEVERLRETEKKLRVINHSLKDDQAIYFSRNLELEQERDQLKAILQDVNASDYRFSVEQLAEHDAEVIERFKKALFNEGRTRTCITKGDFDFIADQLRQRAKDVQT